MVGPGTERKTTHESRIPLRCIRLVVAVVFLFLPCSSAFAQSSAEVRSKIQSSGHTDGDVRQRINESGMSPDEIRDALKAAGTIRTP